MRSLNIAHRGFSGKYPENTLMAFEEAYQAGADGIELDVRLTKDGEVVVFHDPKLDRLTKGKGKVSEHTLLDLEAYPITHPLENKAYQQFIPTLTDYLMWAKNKPILSNIEFKNKEEKDNELELKVAEILRDFSLEGTVLISSFHKKSIQQIKKLLPGVKTALLLFECDEATLHMAKDMGVDFIHIKSVNVTATLVEQAHAYGIGINTWTVNKVKDLERINRLGVEGIITDFPDRLKKIQSKGSSKTSFD